MNIDLRNISEDFEKKVNEIKKEFQISTNSKAVEFCTVNYLNQLKHISELKSKLHDTKIELSEIKKDVKTFTGSFSRLTQIT